mgnify:CR=1 FL=1
MTTEEIKQSLSMHDVLARYGIEVKRNMCSCPFHGVDKHPSMKVFKDGFKCFGCGMNGDVFTFVQEYEHCDFKTAFKLLGGTYQHNSKASDLAVYNAQMAREQRELAKAREEKRQQAINQQIHSAREQMEQQEIGSDEWWDSLAYCFDGITKDLNREG